MGLKERKRLPLALLELGEKGMMLLGAGGKGESRLPERTAHRSLQPLLMGVLTVPALSLPAL